MPPVFLRILLFCLIPVGVYLLIQGIKLLRKSLGGNTVLEIPIIQTEAQFAIPKDGKYAMWQRRKTFGRMAINMPLPAIKNLKNGSKLRLSYPLAVVHSNDGKFSKVKVLTFWAPAGNYQYSMSDDKTSIEAWLTQMRENKKPDLTGASLMIKENRPVFWLVIGILLCIIAGFLIIGGIVFTFNSDIIKNR